MTESRHGDSVGGGGGGGGGPIGGAFLSDNSVVDPAAASDFGAGDIFLPRVGSVPALHMVHVRQLQWEWNCFQFEAGLFRHLCFISVMLTFTI